MSVFPGLPKQASTVEKQGIKKVESYYHAIGMGCTGGTGRDFLAGDIRDIPPEFFAPGLAVVSGNVDYPGQTDNVTSSGKTCYITLQNPWPLGGSLLSLSNVLGSAAQKMFGPTSVDLFIRAQNIKISQRTLSQIKQTFDGVYAGVYGGSIASVSIQGITKLWSNQNTGGTLSSAAPTNTEIDWLQKTMALMSSMKGAVFHYHDGFAARKWGVIPDSFTTSKSTSHNNQEVYTINFKGASYGERLTHIETMAADLFRFTGPTAKYQTKKII
jgi:hypothetical protein